jgi:hypothetical protein
VVDAWTVSSKVIRQDIVECLAKPSLGIAWDLGWQVAGNFTRFYAIAFGLNWRDREAR